MKKLQLYEEFFYLPPFNTVQDSAMAHMEAPGSNPAQFM
jgi:hypothetical protein